MKRREYVVTVKKDANWEELNTELTTDTSADASVDSSIIPDREVTATELRPENTRNTEYKLSDDEATALKDDPRIISVQKIADIGVPEIGLYQDGQDGSSFNKNTTDSGNQDNWGLIRHISETNNFGTSKNDPGDTYDYVLDGTGVDVVIMDTGIQADHPEWEDADGVTRLKQIDWSTTYTGSSYTQQGNTYTDIHGHGTHCAGIVAGKTFGWAKNSRIYSIPINGGNGADVGSSKIFDVVKDWHNAKTGSDAKRPTVVNMSFGFIWYLDTNFTPNRIYGTTTTFTGGSYRGSAHSDQNRGDITGLRGGTTGYSNVYKYGKHISSINADIDQMISAGIHVVIAAGNGYMKQDLSGGNDFNNYLQLSTGSDPYVYYHRGGSPSGYECGDSWRSNTSAPSIDDNNAINVGALDNSSYSSTLDQKVNFSDTGPGVDIYAAGDHVASSCSNTNAIGGTTYSLNSSYKQCRISGTSMAAPQIAGMVACLLQAHPDWSPATVKKWFLHNATDKIRTTGNDNDYTTGNSILGGAQKVAYFPMNGRLPFSWTSS
jgi:subtilisin family serine protease